MFPVRLLSFGLLVAVVLAAGGCTWADADLQSERPSRHASHTPRGYLPLKVRNSCFVESVNFCDFYRQKQLGGADGWAQVLQWGIRKEDFTVKGGHAVAMFVRQAELLVYDINFGVITLKTPVAQKLDLNVVTKEIFVGYPKMKSVLAQYQEDFDPHPETNPPDYSSGATTDDLHDALKVATRLGRFRPVRVVEFTRLEGAIIRPYAVTVFMIGNKMCLYSPPYGTRVVSRPLLGVQDFNLVKAVVMDSFPGADNVQWFQPAGTTGKL